MPTDCGTVTVVTEFNPSEVQTTGCSGLTLGDVNPGEQFSFDYTVENNNNTTAGAVVEVIVEEDGGGSPTTAGSVNKQVPANGTETDSFDVSIDSPGEYNVSVEVTTAEPLG